MGTCISKCKTTSEEIKHPIQHKPFRPSSGEESKYAIQDKLVVSHSPSLPTIPTIPISKNQSPPSSCSPISSSSTSTCSGSSAGSSISTVTTATSNTSTSSSTLNLKDRSFSNDFLRSCIKENPHLLKVDLSPPKTEQEWRVKAHAVSGIKQELPRHPQSQPPQVTRQKSSREETRRRRPASIPRRTLGGQSQEPSKNRVEHRNCAAASRRSLSPSHSRRFTAQDPPRSPIARRGLSSSPSRRFNGDRCRSFARNYGGMENCKCRSTFMESTRPASCMRQIKSQFDQKAGGDLVSKAESESLHMEDVDNPLIALDCFIFL